MFYNRKKIKKKDPFFYGYINFNVPGEAFPLEDTVGILVAGLAAGP
jgi:hypothetical protein